MNTKDAVIDAAKENKHWTNQEIGDSVGVSEATVRRIFKRFPDPRVQRIDYTVPIIVETPIHLPLDDGIMFAPDWHIPLYSREWVNRMLDRADKEKIRRLGIPGDLFNFDSLSQYDPKQIGANLKLELSEGRSIVTMLDQIFDEIIFTYGNHDARFMKSLGHKIGFADSMRAVLPSTTNFMFSNLDHFWIDTPTPWYVCHPRSYSSVPLTTGLKLSDKYNANVVTAHSHHLAGSYAKDGKRIVVEAGGLFDRDKTEYLKASTTFAEWSNGFCWLGEDGVMNIEGYNMRQRL